MDILAMGQESLITKSNCLCSIEYVDFLRRLAIQSLYRHNCTRIYLGFERQDTLSSPFVSSIAATVLLTLPGNSLRNDILLETTEYLMNAMDRNGLIGFAHPNHHRYDLDTLACVYSFLYRFTPELITSRLNNILEFFLDNKCRETGAYYVWIAKERNNIDYFVNVNIGMFFKTIGFEDPTLDEFLFANAYEFVDKGSHYYQDVSFPLFLAFLYVHEEGSTDQHGQFVAALKRLLSAKRAKRVIDNSRMRIHQNAFHGFCDKVRIFPQYFNSKDSIFKSDLLDSIIHYYTDSYIDFCDQLPRRVHRHIKTPIFNFS